MIAELRQVYYEKENEELVAIEVYSDGTRKKVKLKNGITDYVLLGADE